MSNTAYTLATVEDFIGKVLGKSEVFDITQERINNFADCTDDHQWIHVDVERAEKESPFGGTIAHGFLCLSLLAPAMEQAGAFPTDAKQIINYGLDSVRFMAPVPAGSKVQIEVELVEATAKKGGRYLIKTRNTVNIEGSEKPALIAEQLILAMS